ncbi:CYTH domain-containing protein [Nocardioides bizhenqiangii]|uniref:Adenylate cyclase n=1 Tax=Nocardioides bizhenqiangii TaxID=3095076 RepID=A0ABZ0ZVZ5_9ACTN|nr:hypothetical protein [Nocardioides sp. HM61]WQQ28006.1 hypothetical protein SHK19_07175 [Nocardioides sp. HM61]
MGEVLGGEVQSSVGTIADAWRTAMTETAPAGSLAPDQADELATLLQSADSVELKLTVPDNDQRSAVRALEMDPLEAELRQVFFFDTPDLALNRQGVIVRARRTTRRDDSVVKLRPVVPSEVSAELRALKGFGVEVDVMPGGFVCSASLQAKMRAGKVKEALDGERGLTSLFDKRQRAFFADCAPDGMSVDDLTVLGPILVMKLKFSPSGYDGRLVAELWLYPDGSRILELSTKAATTEAFTVAASTKQFLQQRGIDLTGEQQTKTKTALEFFSSELR